MNLEKDHVSNRGLLIYMWRAGAMLSPVSDTFTRKTQLSHGPWRARWRGWQWPAESMPLYPSKEKNVPYIETHR